jgi:hypothetical protein
MSPRLAEDLEEKTGYRSVRPPRDVGNTADILYEDLGHLEIDPPADELREGRGGVSRADVADFPEGVYLPIVKTVEDIDLLIRGILVSTAVIFHFQPPLPSPPDDASGFLSGGTLLSKGPFFRYIRGKVPPWASSADSI